MNVRKFKRPRPTPETHPHLYRPLTFWERAWEDMQWLKKRLAWTNDEFDEVKAQTKAEFDGKGTRELAEWWMRLTFALQAGYEQTEQNGFERLEAWEKRTGRRYRHG
jgi:hypothetical protein